LSNPDTLTKLKTAADISQKVLVKVKQACIPGANIFQICQQGDALLEEETSKVYKGKKIAKGFQNQGGN
jgi:methionine aminopeptidase